MKTLFGAVIGALTLGAVLVSYDLGERHVFSRDLAAYPQMSNPYLMQTGQAGYATPYAPYGLVQAAYTTGVPAGYAAPQLVSDRVVSPAPAVRRVTSQRSYASERVAPKRSWQKSALLIGGSAAGGAGVGALIGGKKGAGIGALLGGGSAAIYDQIKRH